MPSPPLLEFDTLLVPIPGDNPAGEGVPFEVREKLEEARKEIDPDAFAPDDPQRPSEPKYADWPAIIRLAQQTLTDNCKDLLVAARLTEALVKRSGAAGLRDGLHILRHLIDDCWDRIAPSIEDGDLEVRAGPFNWLDEPDRGARFPVSVRQMPLIPGGGKGGYSWFDWRQAQDKKGDVKIEDFEKAVLNTPREQIEVAAEDLDQAADELRALGASLNAKLGEFAPGLATIREALEDARNLAHQLVQRKGGGPAAEEAANGAQGAEGQAAGAGRPSPSRAVATRADAYQRLAEAAELLQQIEPHSPIPYLVRRAVALGALPFPQLMRALIREDAVIQEMNRELGIKEEPPPE